MSKIFMWFLEISNLVRQTSDIIQNETSNNLLMTFHDPKYLLQMIIQVTYPVKIMKEVIWSTFLVICLNNTLSLLRCIFYICFWQLVTCINISRGFVTLVSFSFQDGLSFFDGLRSQSILITEFEQSKWNFCSISIPLNLSKSVISIPLQTITTITKLFDGFCSFCISRMYRVNS